MLGYVEASHNEYCQTLCMALAMWMSWHSALPGHVHVEEMGQALLLRLGALCCKHTKVTDLGSTTNLFLTPLFVTKDQHFRGTISQAEVDHYIMTIRRFFRLCAREYPFTEWAGIAGTHIIAPSPWPPAWTGPRLINSTSRSDKIVLS